jgi:hypothetical protein
MVQSCEDRTGHWLYPISPFNVGYNAGVNSVRPEAFPNQYIADRPGTILKHGRRHLSFIVSDHGIKPLRGLKKRPARAHGSRKTTPVIAKHDFADGDDVPGSFFAIGPGIKHDFRMMGLEASVYDIAPAILHIYGIEQPKQMHGRLLSEIFERAETKAAARN